MTAFLKTVSKVRGWLMLVVAFITSLMDRLSMGNEKAVVEQLEKQRLTDIAERAAVRRAKRREKLAERPIMRMVATTTATQVVPVTVTAPIASTTPAEPSPEQIFNTLLATLNEAVKKGNQALETVNDESLVAARAAFAEADATYAWLKQSENKAKLAGVYSPIKELERAIGRGQRQLDEQKAKSEALAADTARQAADKAEAARKLEEDKQAARETCKKASNDYRGLLDKITMLIEDGEATMARAELETARTDRLTTNQVRERFNALWGEGKKKAFAYSEIKQLEGQIKNLEMRLAEEQAAQAVRDEKKAAEVAKLNESRAALSHFFGVELDHDFRGPADYQPHRVMTASKRCAVCLAQANRLIERLGKQEQLAPLSDAMLKHLKIGLDEHNCVQLCDVSAQQAFDSAGRQYGHRVFNRRLQLVTKHVDKKTGAVLDINGLETEMTKAAAMTDFAKVFEAFTHDQIVLASRKRKPNKMWAKPGKTIKVVSAKAA